MRPPLGIYAGAALCGIALARPGGAVAQAGPPPADAWVTEFGVSAFVGQPPGSEGRRTLLAWELGRSFVRLDRTIDLTGFVATNDNQFRVGLRGRYHLLRDGPTNLYVAPGVTLLHGDDDLQGDGHPGVGLEVGVGVRDRFVVTGELEALGGDPNFRVGVRATSVIGAVSGLALPLAILILIRDD